jgi:hypothetical protein
MFQLHQLKIHDLKWSKSFLFGQFGDNFVKIEVSNIVGFLRLKVVSNWYHHLCVSVYFMFYGSSSLDELSFKISYWCPNGI